MWMGDAERTKAALIEAVGEVLAKRGFRGLGVSAVALQAKVAKPLIYRYFGGLSDLLTAYGSSHDFWPSTDELFATDLSADGSLAYGDYIAGVMVRFVKALRKRPLTRAVLAWGLIESNELTRHLDGVLAQRGRAAVAQLRNRVNPPEGVDVAAQNAILLAGVFFLTIRGGVTGEFSGISLKTAEDWRRVEAALRHIVDSAYDSKKGS
jgi:AcrR family transcriptional regulator